MRGSHADKQKNMMQLQLFPKRLHSIRPTRLRFIPPGNPTSDQIQRPQGLKARLTWVLKSAWNDSQQIACHGRLLFCNLEKKMHAAEMGKHRIWSEPLSSDDNFEFSETRSQNPPKPS